MSGIMNQVNKNIEKILEDYKHIAVVGLSQNKEKPSYGVAKYLQSQGYKIYPVNPKYDEILGEKCYPDLESIDHPIEIVDIFRRPEAIPPIVEEAIKINAKAIWMQLGISNEQAAESALNAGLDVVMDHCMKVEHSLHMRKK